MAVRQVHELCDELLGPLDQPSEPMAENPPPTAGCSGAMGWCPTVVGLSKRGLLRDVVLPALASNRALQRVLAEYIEQLGAVA